jgi:hypothetical protein
MSLPLPPVIRTASLPPFHKEPSGVSFKAYDPNQPREPKGTEEGGQFAAVPSAPKVASAPAQPKYTAHEGNRAAQVEELDKQYDLLQLKDKLSHAKEKYDRLYNEIKQRGINEFNMADVNANRDLIMRKAAAKQEVDDLEMTQAKKRRRAMSLPIPAEMSENDKKKLAEVKANKDRSMHEGHFQMAARGGRKPSKGRRHGERAASETAARQAKEAQVYIDGLLDRVLKLHEGQKSLDVQTKEYKPDQAREEEKHQSPEQKKPEHFDPTIYIFRTGLAGKYKVRVVNGTMIRNNTLERQEFGLYAIHADFPDMVPEGEIWVAGRLPITEMEFFIAGAVAELKALEAGADGDAAYDIAKATMKAERAKVKSRFKEAGNLRDTPVIDESGYAHIDSLDMPTVHVYDVDADMVRDEHKVDFLEGGNSAVYEWIPRGQDGAITIWLESDLETNEAPLVALHEYVESLLMDLHGLKYDEGEFQAHDLASKVEWKYRRRWLDEGVPFLQGDVGALLPSILDDVPGIEEIRKKYPIRTDPERNKQKALSDGSLANPVCPLCGGPTKSNGYEVWCRDEYCEWHERLPAIDFKAMSALNHLTGGALVAPPQSALKEKKQMVGVDQMPDEWVRGQRGHKVFDESKIKRDAEGQFAEKPEPPNVEMPKQKVTVDTAAKYGTEFKVDGKDFFFEAQKDAEGWHIGFGLTSKRGGDTARMTNDPTVSPIKVLSSVGDSIASFITAKKPEAILFTAEKFDESRVRFYNRISEKIGGVYGYDLEKKDYPALVEYILIKKADQKSLKHGHCHCPEGSPCDCPIEMDQSLTQGIDHRKDFSEVERPNAPKFDGVQEYESLLVRKTKDFKEAEHPRGQPENAGQFAEKPAAPSIDSGVETAKPGKEQPKKESLYENDWGSRENPIRCGNNIKLAAKLLAQGKHVQLAQPRQVATLLDKMNKMIEEAMEKGEKAPNFDLCKVSVPGTNLFCVDENTEMMTAGGWKKYDQLVVGEMVLTLNHETGHSQWEPLKNINVFPERQRDMLFMEGKKHSSLTTLDHRWPVVTRKGVLRKDIAREWRTSATLRHDDRVPIACTCDSLPAEPTHPDALVELVSWAVTEGHLNSKSTLYICQSYRQNPSKCEAIRKSLTQLYGPAFDGDARSLREAKIKSREGKVRPPVAVWRERNVRDMTYFYLNRAASRPIRDQMDDNKVVHPEFIVSLTDYQLRLFIERSIDGDGTRKGNGSWWFQRVVERNRTLEMACALAGIATNTREGRPDRRWPDRHCYTTALLRRSFITPVVSAAASKSDSSFKMKVVRHNGIVWCPTTPNGTWLARRNGSVWYTGNCQENIGIPRVRMPQMRGIPIPGSYADSLPKGKKSGKADLSADFIKHLKKQGIGVDQTKIRASNLRASQNEIDGVRITQLINETNAGDRDLREKPIFVTRDDYVVDGHHHWAAIVGWGWSRDKDPKIPVYRLDMDIGKALDMANEFTKKAGLKPKSVPGSEAKAKGLGNYHVKAWAEEDHPRGQPENAGQFAEVPTPPRVGKTDSKPTIKRVQEKVAAFSTVLKKAPQQVRDKAERQLHTAQALVDNGLDKVVAVLPNSMREEAKKKVMGTVADIVQEHVLGASVSIISNPATAELHWDQSLVFNIGPWAAAHSVITLCRKWATGICQRLGLLRKSLGDQDLDLDAIAQATADLINASIKHAGGKTKVEAADIKKELQAKLDKKNAEGTKSLSYRTKEWDERKHPRGQPENAGEFARVPRGPTVKGGSKKGNMQPLLDRLKARGGFTYSVRFKNQPTEGYSASPYPERSFAVSVDRFTKGDLVKFVLRNRDLLKKGDHYLGAWLEEGKAYLDISVLSKDATSAEKLCREKDQIGYYNLAKGEYVLVNPNATSGGVKSYGRRIQRKAFLDAASQGRGLGGNFRAVQGANGAGAHAEGRKGSKGIVGQGQSLTKEWHEEDHPRGQPDNAGQFAEVPAAPQVEGLKEETAEEDFEESTTFHAAPGTAEAVEELDRRFDKIMPELDRLVAEAIDSGEEFTVGGTGGWEGLDDDTKSEIQSQWENDHIEEYMNEAEESWQNDLDNDIEYDIKNDEDFHVEVFDKWAEENGVYLDGDGAFEFAGQRKPHRSFTIDWDAVKIKEPDDPSQPALPDMEKGKVLRPIRDDEIDELEKSLAYYISDARDDELKSRKQAAIDEGPPDSINESAYEAASEAFGNLSSDDLDELAGDNGSPKKMTLDSEPRDYDPTSENGSDQDYRKTGAIAQLIQNKRTKSVLEKRGLPTCCSGLDDIPSLVWSAWKGSSTSEVGWALQLATAEELNALARKEGPGADDAKERAERGYRQIGNAAVESGLDNKLRLAIDETTMTELKKQGELANVIRLTFEHGEEVAIVKTDEGEDARVIPSNILGKRSETLGKMILKAHARATWEASQFVLRKAGKEDLTVWRGVWIAEDDLGEQEEVSEPAPQVESGMNANVFRRKFTRLPQLALKRNGAASATADPSTANSWGGVHFKPANSKRVVMRMKVPRAAVLSLPCFGQNLQNEKEVVVAGTKWKAWDAWLDKAPGDDESIPVKSLVRMRFKNMDEPLPTELSDGTPADPDAFAIDFVEIDWDQPNWLSGGESEEPEDDQEKPTPKSPKGDSSLPKPPSVSAKGLGFFLTKAWDESKHPRGQPENSGEFAEVPRPPSLEKKPQKTRKRKGKYGDDIPMLEDKEPQELLAREDLQYLNALGASLTTSLDEQGWKDDPLGWGRMHIDIEKLFNQVGDDGIQMLKEKGWISKARVFGEGTSYDEWALTRPAKEARVAQMEYLTELRVPKTKIEARKLMYAMEDNAGNLKKGDWLADQIMAYLGVTPAMIDKAGGTEKLLNEMLYRHYNPVPVWERVHRSKRLKKKVDSLAKVWKELNDLPEAKPITEEIQKLNDRGEVLFKEASELTSVLYSKEPIPEEKKTEANHRLEELEKETQQLGGRLSELYDKRMEIKTPLRKKVQEQILKVKKPSPIVVNAFGNYPGFSDKEKGGVTKAIEWMTGKVSIGPQGESVPPYNTINDNSDRIGRGGPSAYYSVREHVINIPTGMDNPAINVHEMGHGIEYKMPGVQSATLRFLNYRVKDEPLQKLKEVLPDSGYASWEEGRKDNFEKAFGKYSSWYVGKKPNGNATEVVSMGVQKLYEDAEYFAQNDPEYCAFILGVLDGSIRDVEVPEQ